MKKRFTEAQIVGFLREADAGIQVKDLCRKHPRGAPSPTLLGFIVVHGGVGGRPVVAVDLFPARP